MLNKDMSLEAEWDAATSFDIHDRNMIWSNYCYFASKDDKVNMEREERIMRSILAKIKLGEPVRLRQTRMDFILREKQETK